MDEKLTASEKEAKITDLKSQILNLNLQKKSILIPRRSLAYQFTHLQNQRSVEMKNRLKKQKRLGYSKTIKRKKNQIDLLKGEL